MIFRWMKSNLYSMSRSCVLTMVTVLKIYKIEKRTIPEIAKILSKSLLVRPRDKAIIKIEMELIFFLPNKSIKDKGKMYETNKTGSLNVPIAL